ncbi:alpha/beta hydrolase [Planctomyces sp. SH-PL14]|uniref:alpha/beta hydrolase n=1 Tax=Planctomyces sp. SH-PL14 TaxID=1632864 RepID=UPI00078D99B1|nr:alpha/beta hydrolase [Planctomyces sp. SH-PL14]AMV22026.1 hypothetical protein VT03_29255 [Planctomyces sp. SH-PL14]
MSRTNFWIVIWTLTVWTVLANLVLFPTEIRGQDFSPVPALEPGVPPALPPLPVPASIPVDPAARPPLPTLTPGFGSCDTPDYWIVSSREAVQHRLKRREDWTLDVFHRHVGGQTVRTSMADLSGQMAPGVPVLICIHGSFVDWNSNFKESAEAYQWIRRAAPHLPIQVIFFSWPSEGPYTRITPIDVAINGERAEFNGFHLAQLISGLPESCPVSLIGHSHGCRVILSTLHIAGGGEIQNLCYRYSLGASRRYRAVLAAAAVDHNWLNPGQRYDRALSRCEGMLNLINRDDMAIFVYPLHRPGAQRALARIGLTDRDYRQLGATACRLSNLDVTQLVGQNHLWPGYYSCPRIATSIVPYVYFADGNTTAMLDPVSSAPPAEPTQPEELIPLR